MIHQCKQLEKAPSKIGLTLKHLTYLYRCRELKLVPSGLSITTSISFRIAWRSVESARHVLTSIAFNADKTRIQDLYKSYNEEFEKVMAHQIWKLKQMKDQSWSSNKTPPSYQLVKVVVNISKHLLITFEETMLKSLNFVTTIRHVKYFDTIVSETSLMIPMA